jgi:inorganic pyrophosphatase
MRIDAISIGIDPPREVNVIIEVPVGGEPIKYEMDKDAGTLVVDRFLYTAMRYPGNYGFIPHTLSGDAILRHFGQYPRDRSGRGMGVRPVGVLLMERRPAATRNHRGARVKLTGATTRCAPTAICRDITLQQIQHFRALQGPEREMGEGVAMGRRRGCAQTDWGGHRAGGKGRGRAVVIPAMQGIEPGISRFRARSLCSRPGMTAFHTPGLGNP